MIDQNYICDKIDTLLIKLIIQIMKLDSRLLGNDRKMCGTTMGGIFDIFFGSNKPRVTGKEYKKAKNEMFSQGFSKRERAKVDEIFAPDYDMPTTTSHPRGLENAEIDARIKWMRENKSKHGLSDHRINEIEQDLKKRV